MDLTEWLVNVAGLRGEMLTVTLDKCEKGFVKTVDDLRELAAMREHFDSLFPPGLLRGKIQTALACVEIPDAMDSTQAVAAKTAGPEKVATETELPEGKR